MSKKLTSKSMRSLALTLVFVLLLGVSINEISLMAEEEVPLLTKEAFLENVLNDNLTVIGLEDQLEDLNDQLDSLGTYSSAITSVHSLVDEYNRLGEKVIYTKENQPRLMEIIFNMVVGSPVVSPAVHPDQVEYVSILAGLSAEDLDSLMTNPGEYAIYVGYGSVMSQFGINTPTVTPDQEYETFILPSYIGTSSLQSGIVALEEGIDSAKGGLSVGGKQLYNTVLMLTDLLDVLNLSYETSVTNYEQAKDKFDKGLIAEISLQVNYNNMISAALNRDKMVRDIDNLKMSMNVMMGRSPNEVFNIETTGTTIIELRSVESYINEALAQRSEIISLNRSIEDQEYKRIFVGDIYEETDNRYIIEAKQLELYKIELEEAQRDITVEVYKAFNDVIEKEKALQIADLELADANRQYQELVVNVEQGYVTESVLANLNLLVTSAVNNASTASRDYLAAVESLLDGSSFGPGSSNTGGTTNE